MDKTLWYIGQGAIPQIDEFADKFVYAGKPNLQLFNMIMNAMADKAQEDQGNKLTNLAWVAWKSCKNKSL